MPITKGLMKLLKLIVHVLLLLLIFVIPSCKSTHPTGSSKTTSKDGLTEQDQINFANLFYNASKEKMLGNFDLAVSLYLQCLQISPRNAAALYEVANIDYSRGNSKQALDNAIKAVEIEPSNIW